MHTLELIIDAEVYAPEPKGRLNLLLGGGRVLWIGAGRPELPAALDVVVTDLGGRRLVPGFIDGHAHVIGGGGESGYGSSVPPLAAGDFLGAGVTTVVGMLGTDDCVRTTGQLVNGVRGLRAQGLGAFCHTGGYHLPPTTLTGSIRGDIVHLDPVIGFGELAISDHRSSQPTFDEFLRLASEVHVAGLMTGKAGILHLHLGDGRRGLDLVARAIVEAELPARTFNPTHVNRRRALFAEAIGLSASGVVIDVTASPEVNGQVTDGPDADLPASFAVGALVEAVAAGRIPGTGWTVSSDGGGCLPVFDAEGILTEMDVGRASTLPALLSRLLHDGIALEHLLPGLTTNPARLLRFADRGRIGTGLRADLVALSDETHGVDEVWCGGLRSVVGGRLARRDTFA